MALRSHSVVDPTLQQGTSKASLTTRNSHKCRKAVARILVKFSITHTMTCRLRRTRCHRGSSRSSSITLASPRLIPSPSSHRMTLLRVPPTLCMTLGDRGRRGPEDQGKKEANPVSHHERVRIAKRIEQSSLKITLTVVTKAARIAVLTLTIASVEVARPTAEGRASLV